MRDVAKRRWTSEGSPVGESEANQIRKSGSMRGEWQEGLASQAPPVALYSTGMTMGLWLGFWNVYLECGLRAIRQFSRCLRIQSSRARSKPMSFPFFSDSIHL
jgi:hypothetical protein